MPDMQRADVVVLGGGIAGLATARALAQAGRQTLLLERERLLASHSTARNAAIWLPTYGGGTTPALARRSAALPPPRMLHHPRRPSFQRGCCVL